MSEIIQHRALLVGWPGNVERRQLFSINLDRLRRECRRHLAGAPAGAYYQLQRETWTDIEAVQIPTNEELKADAKADQAVG